MTLRVLETPATLTRCQQCGRFVLDAIVIGLTTRVDPTPLDRAEQLDAFTSGVEMHTAFIEAGDVWLAFRNASHIQYEDNRPALAEHDCGTVRQPDLELLAHFAPAPTQERTLF